MARRRRKKKKTSVAANVPAEEEIIDTPDDVFIQNVQNDELDDFRPPDNLKLTMSRPIRTKKREIVFTRKKVKAGKFKNLHDFTWNMIHAKKKELVNKISTLLKPIRNYSRKNKRELISVLEVMKQRVSTFY